MEKIFARLMAMTMVFTISACSNNENTAPAAYNAPDTSQYGEMNNLDNENSDTTLNEETDPIEKLLHRAGLES